MLFVINRLGTKAVWDSEITLWRTLFKQLVSIFAIILYRTVQSEMGRRSSTLSRRDFFGIRTKRVLFKPAGRVEFMK